MAQRKKKPTCHQNQAIAHAHHKNEFLHKVKLFVNTLCGEDIYSHFPPEILDRIYRLRFHSLTLVSTSENAVSSQILKSQKQVLTDWLKKDMFDLPKYGIKVLLKDYLTVGLTVFSMYRLIHDHDFATAPKLRSALFDYYSDKDPYSLMSQQLFSIFMSMGWWICNLETGLYWFSYKSQLAEKGKSGMDNIAEVHFHKLESIHVKINGAVRPAIRLGWAMPFSGLNWIGLKPSSLGIKTLFFDQPMKVYVQSHALLRLAERIDSILPGLAQYNMYASFLNAKLFYDSNHHLLIEYRIFETKAGYFAVEVVDKIVVVKTFLFLTQSGTPEGVLLWKNTGLKMLDKKYLAIDKLSTFISSDIDKNEQINKIFAEAGCQSLLELYEKLGCICNKQYEQSQLERMLDYIGINEASIRETITAE